jgi:hypothetical protein
MVTQQFCMIFKHMKFYKKFFLFSIIVVISHQSFSQKVIVHAFIANKKASVKSDTIYYDFNQNLAWSDFKGTPDNNSFAGAVTASGFAFDSQMNFDGTNIYLNIGIYTFFTKSDSWKKPQINSDYHLMHEQHHFDITRLSTEIFLNEVNKAGFTKANYTSLLTSLFNKAYKQNDAIQQQYDKQTNHSLNVGMQNEWNNKIAAEIQKLKDNLLSKN